jgi:serine/threonine protein kinase
MVGQTISHYKVVGQLGSGGMGVVYRAEDIRLGRAVALKFVSEDFAHDPQAVQRLRSEARAASSLNHANICTIYDIDEHEGHPFIVMELMKGRSLRQLLDAGALKVHQLLDIGVEIADALHAAHSEGIIHRDIKPGNIFVTERGHVKILDFGLAKLTSLDVASGTTIDGAERTGVGITLGTVSYMSPEQATGEQLDGRSDLFSLGVVLYECATGRHPFPGKTSAIILAAILNRSPVAPIVLNPELPIRLQEVINNCLEKDRELRYQSAADLRADLKRVRRDIESGHSRAVEAVTSRFGLSSTSRPGSSHTTVVSGGSLAWRIGAAVALVGIVGAGVYLTRRPPPAAPVEPPQTVTAPAPAPDPAIPTRLALATSSLEAHNYRAALTYARQVLALDASNAIATKVRAEALAALARFDEAIAEADRRIAAGDVKGATQALETARGIDPSSPNVANIAARISELSRARETVASARASQPPARERGAPAPARQSAQVAPPVPAPPVTSTSQQQTPPARSEPPSLPPPPAATEPKPAPSPPPAAAATPEPPPVAKPAPPTAENKPRERPPAVAAEDDDAAIRQVTATYARAIEAKDIALFRSIKPNLSREEERRLQEGFRAVTSQRVDLTIVSIDRRGDEASVVVRRRDTIQAGGRQQTTESRQTLMLTRTAAGWKIADIR